MTVLPQQHGASFLLDPVAPEDIVCPEDMGEDERLLIRSIREFAEQEVAPVMDQVDAGDISVIRPLFRKAAELGLFMAEVPEAYGGLGLNVLAIAGMSECRSYLGGLSSTVFAHQGIGTLPLVNFGTKDQIDRYLQRCMSGELMAAFALTEPGSGSDAMNITTTAVLAPEGTHYVVNGAKQWITNAGWADLFILFAKIDGTAFSAFLLERETPGLTVGAQEKLLGLQGSSVCALQLDDVAIPVENLLGEVGKGHKVALCTLNLGRMKMAANCAGTSKKILATTTGYAVERRQFGHQIADFGLIQRKLADMAARAYSAESVAYRTAGLVYNAAEAADAGDEGALDRKLKTLAEFSIECAMAKVIGSETYNGLADEALQIYGGNGYSEEYPAARWYRDSRITRIYEGTSEICRLSIAKTMLKRADRGQLAWRDAVSTIAAPIRGGSAETLKAMRAHVASFKALFFFTLRQIWDHVEPSEILAPEHQQYLGSLADIAIETYRAESTILRVMKLAAGKPETDLRMQTSLAQLTFHHAADRIRQEATEVLAALLRDEVLEIALERVRRSLPLPSGLIETRAFITTQLTARNGTLP
jgi:alkylation response protein AidB-like acyl-CoA dehydrogenase